MSDRQPGMNGLLRRAAARPAPSEEERRHEQRRADEWASLTPAQKLARALGRAAEQARAATKEGAQTQ